MLLLKMRTWVTWWFYRGWYAQACGDRETHASPPSRYVAERVQKSKKFDDAGEVWESDESGVEFLEKHC